MGSGGRGTGKVLDGVLGGWVAPRKPGSLRRPEAPAERAPVQSESYQWKRRAYSRRPSDRKSQGSTITPCTAQVANTADIGANSSVRRSRSAKAASAVPAPPGAAQRKP